MSLSARSLPRIASFLASIAGADIAKENLPGVHPDPGGQIQILHGAVEAVHCFGYIQSGKASLPSQTIFRPRPRSWLADLGHGVAVPSLVACKI